MAQHLDPPAPLVDVAHLDFRYPERALYHDLSLRISRGKVTVIMGPSGCGKSTLLGLMAGRLRPQAGNVPPVGGRDYFEIAKRSKSAFKLLACLRLF